MTDDDEQQPPPPPPPAPPAPPPPPPPSAITLRFLFANEAELLAQFSEEGGEGSAARGTKTSASSG